MTQLAKLRDEDLCLVAGGDTGFVDSNPPFGGHDLGLPPIIICPPLPSPDDLILW